MASRTVRAAAAAASVVLAFAALVACAPEPTTGADASGGSTPTRSVDPTPIATVTGVPTTLAGIPDDCEEMLDDDVRSQLADVPLNDPATGEDTGVQGDGSLVCLWRDPAADTTYLKTTIAYMSRGPALDMLNELADDEDFTCYTPDEGTRCEKTWENEDYPVEDGRTLYWRDGVLIDTQYSNLAPTGYTAAIVESIFG